MNLSKPALALMALMTINLFSSNAIALSTDRDQPAEIEADDIEFDFKKGTRVYTNNVLVVQGTLRLKADKVVAIYKEKDLDTATAWGSLARFKQRPDGKEHDVEGWAKKIIVNQKANTLTLIGKASLKQGPDTARGEKIVYNMATDTLSLSGGAKVGAAGKDGKQMPQRTLDDPFADEQSVGPDAAQTEAPTTAKDKAEEGASKTSTSKNDNTPPEVTESKEPEPVKAGRSRLIIQPK